MARKQLTSVERKRNQEAADWLLRNRETAQTDTEKAAFRRWHDDPENGRIYKAAETLLGDASLAIQSDSGLRDLKIKPTNKVTAVVSSAVAVMALGSLFFMFDGPMRLRADLISAAGEMPLMTLEDGSKIQLNASSAVAFDYDFNRRIVRLLRGQAFFEVAADAHRPFSVETKNTRVTALGTAFDVRAGDTETDVTVTQHAVVVEPRNGSQQHVEVNEGEQVSWSAATGIGPARKIDSDTALAWRRGQLSVDNAPLSYVAEEIGRHFSGRIVIASNALANRRVSGTLSVNDTDAALSFLRTALNVQTYKIGPLIMIRD
ncbi:FecR family protein [Phyllobacterium sp. YR531]|uniref:FecR family protein n=1 Tax=Phyllobacterium sp. YR531 TaxID=1144343 RepID=UPI00026F6CE3|nr:FecR family protein [Phyllobacterium sp. YR531]EJN02561.1 Fe2+-dicitrate sensor, membrane component [Phyllobacterium sp. YR531]